MKKFAIVLALVAGSVSASFANCGGCKSCPSKYAPGQTFVTKCGRSAPKQACKPVAKPVCAPVVCKPVCKPACR